MDNENKLTDVKQLDLPFTLKADVNDKEYNRASEYMLSLHNTFDKVRTAYAEMAGDVARLYSLRAWEYYTDCKSFNDFVKVITGATSNGTVSDLIKVAKAFYNSDGTIKSGFDKFCFSSLRYLAKLSDDEMAVALPLLNKVEHLTRNHVVQLVDYIKKGNDAKALFVENDRFMIPANETTEETAEETAEETTEETAEETTEESTEENAEGTSSTGENEKAESTRVEQSQLSKEAVENIMNVLIKLRAGADRLSKSEIKKQLDKIIEDLGVISK